jgi:hypothetical protein
VSLGKKLERFEAHLEDKDTARRRQAANEAAAKSRQLAVKLRAESLRPTAQTRGRARSTGSACGPPSRRPIRGGSAANRTVRQGCA